MYILAIKGKETEGAYAPSVDSGQILYLFLDAEDAERHSELLAADDYPEMSVVEVDDDVAIHICEENGYSYCIVTPEDIIIPPKESDD
jgi:hypothetical protein|tara:strand:+ start:2081 stop:2344 length:264 start_codon:yes stop_codon:yes gene_type:complete